MLNLARRSHVTSSMLDEGLEGLGLDGRQHLIVHSSLRSFGTLEGGAAGLLEALRGRAATVVTPAFSYQTLLRAPEAPVHTRFTRQTRVSRDIGRLAQTLVEHPAALRSFHPALSFVALGQEAAAVTSRQSLENPYGPIGALYDLGGLALLMGVDHSSDTSIHYGEYLAGMPLLTRYLPLEGGVRASAFPNCSADFDHLAPRLRPRSLQVGKSRWQLFRVRELVDQAAQLLRDDPEALLCTYPSCRCQQVRREVRARGLSPRPHQPAALLNSAGPDSAELNPS